MISKIKKVVHFFVDRPLNRIWDIVSTAKISAHLSDVRRQKKEERKGFSKRKIRVAFISQMPEVWGQQSSTYERLAADDRFEVEIVCVPQFDIGDRKFKNYKAVKDYFKTRYPDAVLVDAVGRDKKVLDLKDKNYDYVFYERPYDIYLPKSLRCSRMCRYTKTCYIPYSTPDFKPEPGYNAFEKEFYRNVYIGFQNAESNIRVLYDSMYKRHRKYHHFVNLGYPLLNDAAATESIPHEKYVIMWTPRWSYDAKVGGSHFLEYKDTIINLGNEFDDTKILARPHPFTYTYMVNNGFMTEKDVEDFKKKALDNGVSFDENKSVIDSFKAADILVTDLSSIMWLFFFMGKPVIYCPCDYPLSDEVNKLIDAMYVAKNVEDIRTYIKEIISGNDYKKLDRQKFVDAYMKKNSDPAGAFVDYLVKDFSER
ncbi:MAG: CDP-glycerol glycerophosphotransferase family protein [Lachnospiraceae bacterium]|nr:CDP-glycerol glycerophosphotransferase family protein [Lachnospiraceae bacterium]